MIGNYVLFIVGTQFIVCRMRSDPADKQVYLSLAEGILTNHPVVVASDIKHNPAGSVSKKISRPKVLLMSEGSCHSACLMAVIQVINEVLLRALART
jgi:hypothetical protein